MQRFKFVPLVVLAAATAGCSGNIIPEGQLKMPTFFGKSDWSSTTKVVEADFASGPAPAEELVDANGACPGAPVAVAQASDPSAPPPVGAPIAGGIALGMTECQVVQRAGQPGNIQIGGDAGERTTVLSYMGGPWPGIYKFSSGRLKEVERVAMPEPPPTKPKPAKKKKKPAPKPA